MKPATRKALQLVAAGKSWGQAAAATGVAKTTILRALRRLNAPRCPHCGQCLPDKAAT